MERTCIVSGLAMPPEGLVRFALAPDGRVVPDVAGSLPGRGVWVESRRDVLLQAVAKNAFARAMRRKVDAPETLADLVPELLRKRMLDLLSISRKSGGLIGGFEKVKAALDKGQVKILLHAREATPDGIRKLYPGEVPVLQIFSRAELEKITTQSGVTHLAVLHAGLAKQILMEAQRFAGFQNDSGL